MTANEVDLALAAPIAEVGPRLLAVTEDQWFDRKSMKIAAKDLAPALVAFANAEGGTIVVGLSNGKVEGLRANAKKINDFRQAPIDFTVPPVRAHFKQVGCHNDQGTLDSLLIVRVDPGERVHETHNGDCYLRIGDESRRLNFAQRQELEFDKGQSQYDGFPVPSTDVKPNHLSKTLLGQFRTATGASGTDTSLLQARSLLTIRKELTNAGYLLFHDRPQDLFPQAYVRVVRFLTNERGTGARLGVEEGTDHRVEGPIPLVIEKASEVIDKLVPRRRALGDSGRFDAAPLVPRDAWLEGLVNAVIHRSYSLAGDHIRVEIYPNRIEIESPGRFPGLADPSSPLNISRYARNPRIARVCADLRIGQELGEGIKRIFDEMRAVGLTDPVYRQSGGSVRLSLQAIPRLDPRLASRLPEGSQRVLDTLRAADRPLGTGEIAEAIGASRPSTIRRMRALQEAELVTWHGNSANDPRATWALSRD